jgi:hypothetical protein
MTPNNSWRELALEILHPEVRLQIIAMRRVEPGVELPRELVSHVRVQLLVYFIGYGRFVVLGCRHHVDPRSFNLIKKTECFTSVEDEKDLLVHVFNMHLVENLCQIFRVDQVCILHFEKVLTSVSVPVNEDFRVLVRHHSLALR